MILEHNSSDFSSNQMIPYQERKRVKAVVLPYGWRVIQDIPWPYMVLVRKGCSVTCQYRIDFLHVQENAGEKVTNPNRA